MNRVQKFRSVDDMARAAVVVTPGDGFERFARHCAVYSSPAIGADGTVYVGSSDNKLYAISPPASGTTGVLKWSFTAGNDVSSSPAIGADGTVYVGSYDGRLYAIH